jgi:hypothetical protein
MRYTPDLGAALVKRTWILVVLPDQAAPVKCASNPALNCKATMKLEHGQVAVVTNVATGMGRSLALQLAAKGVCRRPPTLAPRSAVAITIEYNLRTRERNRSPSLSPSLAIWA